MGKTILITGITGFLGSHLAEHLLIGGNRVVGLKRESSDDSRCASFKEKVTWVTLASPGWKEQLACLQPEVIVHAAWEGVSAGFRNELRPQLKNMELLLDLLEIAGNVKSPQFIGLGSQAEYGYFDGKISEQFAPSPSSGYGLSKLVAMETVKYFCEQQAINWYWLRLFPLFGEKESGDWLIPMLVKNIYSGEPMDMTAGEQQYAYLYVKDFTAWMERLIASCPLPGVYNISSAIPRSLKEVVQKVMHLMDRKNERLNLGALPYRPNQAMLMIGDTTKLSHQLGLLDETDFDGNLEKTIKFILQSIDEKGS